MTCFGLAFFDHLSFCASIAAFKTFGISSCSTRFSLPDTCESRCPSVARTAVFGGLTARKRRPRCNLLPIGTFAQELGNTPVTKTERYTLGVCYNWRANSLR
jgi:hypothetical protein